MEFSVMMGILMEGFALTAEIFLITLVGSLSLGVVVALARMSKFKPLAWLAQLYISILRGTPLMLQLMAIMFGPYYLFGLNMGSDWKFWACAIGFILNYAASSPKSTVRASSLFRAASTRRPRCWATPKSRPS